MSASLPLLKILADGRFHSGEELGRRTGVSRAAVWSAVQELGKQGLEVNAVRGKGYRLAGGIELLDEAAIRRLLGPKSVGLIDRFEIIPEIESTNRYLMDSPAPGVHACLAECQSGGRGRRGRQWVSPFGRNIYLSVAWPFEGGAAHLGGLSLAAGVAVIRALEAVGIEGAGVKWPNDIVWGGAKLAGILLELSGESNGPCRVVVGIGLNVGMNDEDAGGIDQEWTDVRRIGSSAGRNHLAGVLLDELVSTLDEFERSGFGGFRDAWQSRDVLHGERVVLYRPHGELKGRAAGIDADGSLLLDLGHRVERVQSGEVSLRAAD